MITVLMLFLLINGGIPLPDCSTTGQYARTHRVQLVEGHNYYRAILARGDPYNPWDIYQPGSELMFQMRYSCELEKIAKLVADKCERIALPEGLSLNFYRTVRLPKVGVETLPSIAMWRWHKQIYHYGLDDNATYVNTNMEEFANMMYYKSTELGCYYNECLFTSALACVYSSAPQINGPIFIPGGAGCKSDEACSSIIANSTCIGWGQYYDTCARSGYQDDHFA